MSDQEQAIVLRKDVAPITALDIPMINMQVQTAKQFPRESLAKLTKKIEADIKADAQIAAQCFYRRPVGKTKEGKVVYAEGASVRLAEMVASVWGNLVVQVSADEREDGRGVVARCRVYDAERNVAIEVPAFRTYTSTKADARQNTYNAAVSFAYRGGIFKIVPKAMAESLRKLAQEVVAKKVKSPKARRDTIEQMLGAFGKFNVGADELCEYVSVEDIKDFTPEHIVSLRGLFTALSDGDITVREAFPSKTFAAPASNASRQESKATEAEFEVSDEDITAAFGEE